MKIFIVDNNEKFRWGLTTFIEKHLKHKVVGQASDGPEFLEKIIPSVDIVLMDINMPEMNGIIATKQGLWRNSQIKIIAISQYKDSVDLQQLVGAGFKGFISKTEVATELEKTIELVQKGQLCFPDDIKIL